MLYALADCSFGIRRTHVESALAVWEYAEESARYTLHLRDASETPTRTRFSKSQRVRGRTDRTEVRDLVRRTLQGEELDRIMGVLTQAGRVRSPAPREREQETGGEVVRA
jgi:hypothetical protein